MAENNPSSKPAIPGALIAAIAFVIVIGVVAALRMQGNRPGTKPSQQNAGSAGETGDGKTRTALRSVPDAPGTAQSATHKHSASTTPDDPATSGTPDAAPEPEQNAKTDFLVEDFTNYSKSLDGYKLDGLEQTGEGITLSPAKSDDGTSDIPVRIGTLETPTLPLKFPSNMVAPLWRNKLPDGTSINIEVTLSADDKEWTQWFPVEPTADEISPTYPDGRPNPNYGYIGGTPVGMGLKLYPFMKYRVTLTSSNESNPVLETIRVFQVDSTLDQGYLANNPPPTEGPERADEVQPPAAPGTDPAAPPESTPAPAVENATEAPLANQ